MTLIKVRIDKWLWAVRLYKTRTLASEACRSGHIKLAGATVKPSHEVKVGEILSIRQEPLTRTVQVLGLIEKRVGAALVKDYLSDQTPAEEYERARAIRAQPMFHRPKGMGRPTKKDRRAMLGIQNPE